MSNSENAVSSSGGLPLPCETSLENLSLQKDTFKCEKCGIVTNRHAPGISWECRLCRPCASISMNAPYDGDRTNQSVEEDAVVDYLNNIQLHTCKKCKTTFSKCGMAAFPFSLKDNCCFSCSDGLTCYCHLGDDCKSIGIDESEFSFSLCSKNCGRRMGTLCHWDPYDKEECRIPCRVCIDTTSPAVAVAPIPIVNDFHGSVIGDATTSSDGVYENITDPPSDLSTLTPANSMQPTASIPSNAIDLGWHAKRAGSMGY